MIARIPLAKRLLVAAVLGACAAARPAVAGGLQLYEIGTDDVGLASAGYGARAQDASTILTNPAGMTRLDGSQLLLGGQLLYGNLRLSLDSASSPALGTGDGGNPVGWFPGAGAFVSFSPGPSSRFKLGVGVAGNFGLSEKYDEGWAGRYYIQEATLLGVSVLPSVAYRVSDEVSLGLSLNAVYGIFDQKVAINNPDDVLGGSVADGRLELDDRAWGLGANIGLLYAPSPATRLGLTYNSQVNLDFSAPADFSGLAPGLETTLGNRGLLGADVDLGIHVPQGSMVSVFHQVCESWAVLASAGWQQWSRFGKTDIGVDSNDPSNITTDIPFKDTWHAAFGAQYKISKPWLLNFGAAYDSSFQDSSVVSPAIPADAAIRFGLGARRAAGESLSWGIATEYVYGGTLHVAEASRADVALGGRGDLVGTYHNAGIFFLAANLSWAF